MSLASIEYEVRAFGGVWSTSTFQEPTLLVLRAQRICCYQGRSGVEGWVEFMEGLLGQTVAGSGWSHPFLFFPITFAHKLEKRNLQRVVYHSLWPVENRVISSAGCREVTSIKDTSSCVALRHLRSTYKGTGLRKQSDAWFDLTRTLRTEAELIDSADLMSFHQTRQDTLGLETAPRSGVARAGGSFIRSISVDQEACSDGN